MHMQIHSWDLTHTHTHTVVYAEQYLMLSHGVLTLSPTEISQTTQRLFHLSQNVRITEHCVVFFSPQMVHLSHSSFGNRWPEIEPPSVHSYIDLYDLLHICYMQIDSNSHSS